MSVKGVAQIFKKASIKPGPHHIEYGRSSMTCSCGFEQGTVNRIASWLLAQAHAGKVIPYRLTIIEKDKK